MKATPKDTTKEAMRKQDQILRQLGPSGRAAMTFELSDNVRSLVEAGIRSRHPEWQTETVRREVLRLMIGDQLFLQIHPQ